MTKQKRFSVKPSFGHWSVFDLNTNKKIVAYTKKEHAELTANGLNRLRKKENITKMMEYLKTKKGYGHYVRLKKGA